MTNTVLPHLFRKHFCFFIPPYEHVVIFSLSSPPVAVSSRHSHSNHGGGGDVDRPRSTEPTIVDPNSGLRRACSLSDLNRPPVTRRILPAPPANGNRGLTVSNLQDKCMMTTFTSLQFKL